MKHLVKFNKDFALLRNVAMVAIAGITLLYSSELPKIYLNGIIVIAGLSLIFEIISNTVFCIKYYQEKRYMKYIKGEVDRELFNIAHNHFANTDRKNYPDQAFEIAAITFEYIREQTDLISHGYQMYLTRGAIHDYKFKHPHYWITILTPKFGSDTPQSYPFIIDMNTLRYKADRDMPFEEVIKTYRTELIDVDSKEYKNYIPFNFVMIDDTLDALTYINDRYVNFVTETNNKLSITDSKTIFDMIYKKRANNVRNVLDHMAKIDKMRGNNDGTSKEDND